MIAGAMSDKPRSAGRPVGSPILTEKVIKDFARFLKAGNFFETVAPALGFTTSAAYKWLSNGRELIVEIEEGDRDYDSLSEGERRYVDFVDAVARASAKAETYAVGKLQVAMKDDPRWIVEFLKRRYPDRWGDRIKAEGGGAENMDLNRMLVGIVRNALQRTQSELPAAAGDGTEPIDADFSAEEDELADEQ